MEEVILDFNRSPIPLSIPEFERSYGKNKFIGAWHLTVYLIRWIPELQGQRAIHYHSGKRWALFISLIESLSSKRWLISATEILLVLTKDRQRCPFRLQDHPSFQLKCFHSARQIPILSGRLIRSNTIMRILHPDVLAIRVTDEINTVM